MIDEIYLLQAAQIRRDYLNLNKKIEGIEEKVKAFPDVFQTHQEDLENIKFQVDHGLLTDKENFAQSLLKIIEDLESKTSSYEQLVEDVQEKMDNLERDEEVLFEKIRAQYTDLPLSIIKEEVNKYLKKQNLL
jgi:phage shock protein A